MLEPTPTVPLPVPRPQSRRRRVELDALRVASMAGVVGIHVLATALTGSGLRSALPYLALDRLLNAACVPAFLFLTGMLVWGAEGRADGRWWVRHGKVVFVPYVAWSLLYAGLSLASRHVVPATVLADLPRTLLFGTAMYHLWFPPVLLLVYALTPLARLLRRVSPELLAIGVLGASLAVTPVLRTLPLPADAEQLLVGLASFVPFAAAGAWFAAREDALRSARWPLAAGAAGWALLVAEAFGAVLPDALTVTATVAALAFAVRMLEAQPPARVARGASLSFGVYLAHPLVLAVVREPLARAGLAGLWRFPLFTLAAYAAILAVTLAFVAGLKRRRALAWLA